MTKREQRNLDFTHKTKAVIDRRRRELIRELIRDGQHYSRTADRKIDLRQEMLADTLIED